MFGIYVPNICSVILPHICSVVKRVNQITGYLLHLNSEYQFGNEKLENKNVRTKKYGTHKNYEIINYFTNSE